MTFHHKRNSLIFIPIRGVRESLCVFVNNVFSVQIIPQQTIRLSKKYGIYTTREFLLLYPGLFNYSSNVVVRLFNIKELILNFPLTHHKAFFSISWLWKENSHFYWCFTCNVSESLKTFYNLKVEWQNCLEATRILMRNSMDSTDCEVSPYTGSALDYLTQLVRNM